MKGISPFIDEYVEFLRSFLREDAAMIDVVFDCSNGATGPVIDRLFPDSIILNGLPDGNFPNHAPDPLHKGSMDALQAKVISDHADIGIIFDADGDRMFVVDDNGRIVDPDTIAYLLLWHLRPQRFVSDVRAGWLVKQHLFGSAQGGPFAAKRIESRVGHYFIKQAMRKQRAEFGHEGSGHYYFSNFFHCDAGIMAAIEVLNALAKLPYQLSEFIDLLPVTHKSPEINIAVPLAAHDAVLNRIEKQYARSYARRSTLDGLTLAFADPDWWFNVRFSNTEPLARLHLEARDKAVYDAQLGRLTELFKNGKQRG